MPGRRKTTQTAVIEEPETTTANIESVNKEEVDQHVKPLLDSAPLSDTDPQQVPDEERLKDLMARMLHARERAQEATERVREINAELVGRSTVPDTFKEKYKMAVQDLTMSRRAASLTRAELVAAMKGWHRSLRMAY
jgi:hypothetical protein